MRPTAFVTVVFVVAPLTDAVAQEQAPRIEPGTRVRVTAPDLGIDKQAVTFQAVESGVLVVTADTTMRCPLSSLKRIDVYAGRHSHALLGAGIGTAAFGLAGFGVVSAVCSGNDCSFYYSASDVLVGLAGSAVLGAVVGLLIKTDRWEEVPLDRLRVSFAPQRNGHFGLALSVRF